MLKNKFASINALAVCSFLFVSFQAFGQDADISTQIEDPAFKSYCLSSFDTNKDGKISLEEASQAEEISVPFEDIKTLKGIEYFVNITTLDCAYNQLTSLDVCKNTALWRLDCSSNQLTSLDVSGDVALKELICWGNKLTSLDVSKNAALTQLNCYSNKLTNLDVRNNPALTLLHCHENQLTGLDVSKNTALEELVCYKNQLASLDISMNKKLRDINCGDIQLIGGPIKIDDPVFKSYCLSNFDTNKDGEISETEAALVKDIDVHGMKIRSLKGIELFTNLTQLRCMSNLLTSLDVSKNTALEVLHCGWNRLTSLDVSKNTALRVLSCEGNNLKNLDVSKNTKLTSLDCGQTQLTSLDISKNTQLKSLDCRWNQFTTLDVSNNALLNELRFDGSVIGNAQQKNALPYWVFDYKWSYTSTVKGTRNVPASRDYKISFEYGTENPFSITITNRSPLQADNWQRTWKGTYTYSNGKIILSYNSERTVLIIDYENKCLRFENGERLAKSYS